MSFIISVYTNEGIIMASDSRSTYTTIEKRPDGSIRERIGIQLTDTTYKTFLCNSRIGISACGDSVIDRMPIAGFIESFIRQKITDDISVQDVCKALLDFFVQFHPLPQTLFTVAGYNIGEVKPCIRQVDVEKKQISAINTSSPGATWSGETTILQRVISDVALKTGKDQYLDLPNHAICFHYFTLQDAISFAQYAVDITIKTMSFQNCVKTVGGPIDILAIKPDGAFWVQRKELHA